jgi:hypothetical protein
MTRSHGSTSLRRLAIHASLLLALVASGTSPSLGQTVPGDIIRARGAFYRDFGWYELNSARAASINVDTWSRYNRETQRLYQVYMKDRAMNLARKKGLTDKTQAAALKEYEQAQSRYRLGPKPEDITSGMALNALVGDLADATIPPSVWRSAKVDLPTGLTLTSLSFKVVGVPGLHAKLMESTVAVDRMKAAGEWPLPFRRAELDAERKSYLAWIEAVLAKCRKGTPLQATDYENLRATVEVLRTKVPQVVPVRENFRRNAQDYVRALDDATKIFADQGFAEELIRDLEAHKATTVAELLGFMRQYRLVFAETDADPAAMQTYDALYQALQQQKAKLDLPKVPPGGFAAVAAEGFGEIPLFNGKNLEGWRAFHLGKPDRLGVNFVADRGQIHGPGSAQGRIQTVNSYSDFVLKAEYCFTPGKPISPAGSGISMHSHDDVGLQIQGSRAAGAIEYQVKPGESGDLVVLGRPQHHVPSRGRTERPVGNWNELEIRFDGPDLVFSLNGVKVNQVVVTNPRPVHVELIAQGSDVRFRNLRIIPLGGKRVSE